MTEGSHVIGAKPAMRAKFGRVLLWHIESIVRVRGGPSVSGNGNPQSRAALWTATSRLGVQCEAPP